MAEAVAIYQQQFDATQGGRLQTLLALPVMVADTDEEAQGYAAEVKVVRLRLESGRTYTIGALEAAEAFGRQAGEPYTITVQQASVVYGAPATVRQKLTDIQSRHQADEIIAVTAIPDFQKRLYSYERLSEALAPVTASP